MNEAERTRSRCHLLPFDVASAGSVGGLGKRREAKLFAGDAEGTLLFSGVEGCLAVARRVSNMRSLWVLEGTGFRGLVGGKHVLVIVWQRCSPR
jgi:hypothetical protein